VNIILKKAEEILKQPELDASQDITKIFALEIIQLNKTQKAYEDRILRDKKVCKEVSDKLFEIYEQLGIPYDNFKGFKDPIKEIERLQIERLHFELNLKSFKESVVVLISDIKKEVEGLKHEI
jgi:hypothetical protein